MQAIPGRPQQAYLVVSYRRADAPAFHVVPSFWMHWGSHSLLGHQLPSLWFRWSTLPFKGSQSAAQATEGPKARAVPVGYIKTGFFNNAKLGCLRDCFLFKY